MKCLVVLPLLLPTLGLTFAVPAFDLESLEKYLSSTAPKELQHEDEVSALLQAIASTSTEKDQVTYDDDEDDGPTADLQGIFNVLAQVEAERAQQQGDKNVAMAYLKQRYCTEEEELIAML